jgi:hypothetical protein
MSGKKGTGHVFDLSRLATTIHAKRMPLKPTVLVPDRAVLPVFRIRSQVKPIITAVVNTIKLTLYKKKFTDPKFSSSSMPKEYRLIMLKPKWSGSKCAVAPEKDRHSSYSTTILL